MIPVDADGFNTMIDEVIDCFVAENIKHGVEGIKELAEIWKASGESRHSFTQLCAYIENEAVAKSSNELLRILIRGELITQTEDKIILH